MKYIKVVPIGLAIMLTAACGNTKKQKDKLTIRPEKTVEIKGLIKGTIEREVMSNQQKDTAAYKVDFAFFLDLKPVWKDSVNQLIGEHLFNVTNSNETKKYTHQLINLDYFNQQLDEFEANYRSFSNESLNDFVWDINGSNTIDTVTLKKYVQVTSFYSFYTGGAHPNSSSLYKVFDKNTGAIIKWQQLVNDTLSFEKLFMEEFKSQHNVKSEKDLSDNFFFQDNKIYVPNDFEFTKENLVFYYNPYEVAPYVYGLVRVEVPLKKIQKMLVVE